MLYILVGPGGVGKNALMKQALRKLDDLRQLATATTRPMRSDEKEGREHQFISRAQFQQLIADNALVEYQEVHPGKFYGVPRQTIEDAIQAGQDLVADLDVLGMSIIRREYPDNSRSIFIVPPSDDALVERLQNRRASEKEMHDRLRRAAMEMLYAPQSDYLIVNDDMQDAVQQLLNIIQIERGNAEDSIETDHIRFRVEVSLCAGHNVVVKSATQALPSRTFKTGIHPQTAASELVKDLLGGDPDKLPELNYVRPDDSSAFSCAYDEDEDVYWLTYHFMAQIDPSSGLPAGFKWRAEDTESTV